MKTSEPLQSAFDDERAARLRAEGERDEVGVQLVAAQRWIARLQDDLAARGSALADTVMIEAQRDRARVVARGLLQRLGFERDHPIIKELAAEIDGWRS